MNAEKTGFLNQDYQIFYLKTTEAKSFSYHYHEFYKILIFLQGDVDYFVEGKHYFLQPYDVVFIQPGNIHCPILQSGKTYERIILYIATDFFEKWAIKGYSLVLPFQIASENDTDVLHFKQNELLSFYTYVQREYGKDYFAEELMTHTHFFQYLIHLNRISSDVSDMQILNRGISNKKILDIISYINEQLEQPLDIEMIANHFYWSRSYLMHFFKKETGLTLGHYITDKRMYLAQKKLTQGCSVTEAWMHSGYRDYQTFYKAYKKKFGIAPSDTVSNA